MPRRCSRRRRLRRELLPLARLDLRGAPRRSLPQRDWRDPPAERCFRRPRVPTPAGGSPPCPDAPILLLDRRASPRLRNENRTARRTAAGRRKKKPKMPSRRNERRPMSLSPCLGKREKPAKRGTPHRGFTIADGNPQKEGAVRRVKTPKRVPGRNVIRVYGRVKEWVRQIFRKDVFAAISTVFRARRAKVAGSRSLPRPRCLTAWRWRSGALGDGPGPRHLLPRWHHPAPINSPLASSWG